MNFDDFVILKVSLELIKTSWHFAEYGPSGLLHLLLPFLLRQLATWLSLTNWSYDFDLSEYFQPSTCHHY